MNRTRNAAAAAALQDHFVGGSALGSALLPHCKGETSSEEEEDSQTNVDKAMFSAAVVEGRLEFLRRHLRTNQSFLDV